MFGHLEILGEIARKFIRPKIYLHKVAKFTYVNLHGQLQTFIFELWM